MEINDEQKGGRVIKEFKEFAVRGNVIDMAVGIIIGAAFGSVVNSLVADILMPPVGLIMGKVDFGNLFAVLKEGKASGPYVSLAAAKAAGAVTVNYGVFINHLISFVIVSFSVFILVRSINKLRSEQKPAPSGPENKECPFCLSVIPARAVRCGHCTSDLKM